MPQDQATSPFHKGERLVQSRLGVRDRVEAFAERAIRDHMPGQHREFYARLPFLMLGTVDAQGRPWASLVPGRPGFMTSPDEKTLEVAAHPLFGDPLAETLEAGRDVGVLGIELETRRRNRMTGRFGTVRPDGFSIMVDQTFGNCPQYIQTRGVGVLPAIDAPPASYPLHRSATFDSQTRRLIETADTLFIATAYTENSGAASEGADISHRGGKPGFVRVEGDSSFVFPDFSGNNHFNTVGNIVLNPRTGLLFADFAKGNLVYMTGNAEIQWDGPEVSAFTGAERLIRFHAEEVIRVDGSLPLRFDFGEYSPVLDRTGSWPEVTAT